MKFKEESIESFKKIFLSVKGKIESQPGCYSVELLIDLDDPKTLFTYSIWEDQASLDAYRNSPLFASVWPITKAMFSEKPKAWSLDYVEL